MMWAVLLWLLAHLAIKTIKNIYKDRFILTSQWNDDWHVCVFFRPTVGTLCGNEISFWSGWQGRLIGRVHGRLAYRRVRTNDDGCEMSAAACSARVRRGRLRHRTAKELQLEGRSA